MNDLRTAAQQALEALEAFLSDELRPYEAAKTSDALRTALAQQAKPQGCDHCNHPLYAATKCRVCGRATEQAEPVEPVAWMLTENEKYGNSVVLRKHKPKTYDSDWWTVTPLYTAPPQRKPVEPVEPVAVADRLARHGIPMPDEP